MRTPFKGDQDSLNITQTREYSRGKKLGSGTKYDPETFKMVDLDNIDDSKIERHLDQPKDRNSTIKQLLEMYEEEIGSKLMAKQMDNSREMAKENTVLQTDKKRMNDLYQKAKRELEITKDKLSELQTTNDRIVFELKAKKNELAIETKKRDTEISTLKEQNKSLSDELSGLINYKSKYEAMKAENEKFLEYEETMEEQIAELQQQLAKYKHSRNSSRYSDSEHKDDIQKQLAVYSDKILSLETKLQQKDQELRDERVESDHKLNKEVRLLEDGFKR